MEKKSNLLKVDGGIYSVGFNVYEIHIFQVLTM